MSPHRSAGSRFTRRQAITALAASTALGVPAPGSAHDHGHHQSTPPSGATPVAGASPVPQFVNDVVTPELITSVDGVLSTTLTATPAVVDIGAAKPISTYTYNGVIPGPTLEVSPGDTMRITLENRLPQVPEEYIDLHDMTRPHAWTGTNVHYHGMHVSPRDNSDNVFLDIAPGDDFDYQVEIPDDHAGGLFWYHPHKHGGVAQQVRAGMAGALIVRGAIDEVPEVAAAREQVLVLQALEMGDDYELLQPIPFPTGTETFFPVTQTFFTVNGQLQPRITMYPGEVQRWRILNAASNTFLSLHLEMEPLHVIAWDGLTLAEPHAMSDVMLAPGARAEVLVKVGEAGRYQVNLTPGTSTDPNIPGLDYADTEATPKQVNVPSQPLLMVDVSGSGPEMSLPVSLPAYDPPIHEIVARRDVRYTVEVDPKATSFADEFLNLGIDGVPFDPAMAPLQMKLGTAEEWTVINSRDPLFPEHAHTFHIHINPFKVTKKNGIPLETPVWRDTLEMVGGNGDSFTCEMNLDDFTGTYVHHCHVLFHEDLGMMASVEVVEE